MDIKQITVATMTLARNESEEQVLREAVASLADVKVPVIVTDGGSGGEFHDYLDRFADFKVMLSKQPGVFVQTKQSLGAAFDSGAKFILYTEPDKKDFFEHKLRRFITAAPGDTDIGVVVAARSAAGFATFPEFQRYTESAINRFCEEVIGVHGDYSYGPIILNRELVPYLNSVTDQDLGWGWRHYLFGLAHRLGYKIVHLVDDFSCPPEQRTESAAERRYRMLQLGQNIHGLLLSTSRRLSN